MILDDIRKIRRRIDWTQNKIDSISWIGGIQFDQERVQSSPSGDGLVNKIIQKMEWEEQIRKLERKIEKMMKNVDMSIYTDRQQDFIKLFYFQGLTQTECCRELKIKISAVCRLKQRVESKNI